MKSRKIHHLLSLAALAVLALLAGCSDDATGPATITQEEADDLATQASASLAVDNGGLLALLPVVGAEEPAKSLPDSGERTGELGSLSYRYSVRFYNKAGEELPGYDPELTVRLQTELRVEGDVTTLRYQAQVRHRSQLQVHGINAGADTLTFNGDANDTCQGSFTALMAQYQRHVRVESHATIQNVQYLKPVEAGELPLSGLVTMQMTASRFRDAARTQLEAQVRATVTVRFTGGDEAEVEVEGGWTYQLNLRTGEIVRA